MKKIILIACLLAWQGVAAAPAKPVAHSDKPVAGASKKTAVKAADNHKNKPAAKQTAEKKAGKSAKPAGAAADKPARKTAAAKPAAKAEKSGKAVVKNHKTATAKVPAKTPPKALGKAGKKAEKTTAGVGKPQASPLSGAAKTRHNVLLKGKKYIGTPYLWGGTTPKGFDCSGLIHYLYGKQGISIPRNSREQFSRLQATSDPQPGDLVFFRKKGVINHVGLYLGNGQMLHAPQTGMSVRIENIKRGKWPGRYAGARKVLKDKSATTLAASGKGKKAAAGGKLIAKNGKVADSKAKLAQRKVIAANDKRLAKESKTIRSKGRIVSAR
mgnify:FL=1